MGEAVEEVHCGGLGKGGVGFLIQRLETLLESFIGERPQRLML